MSRNSGKFLFKCLKLLIFFLLLKRSLSLILEQKLIMLENFVLRKFVNILFGVAEVRRYFCLLAEKREMDWKKK